MSQSESRAWCAKGHRNFEYLMTYARQRAQDLGHRQEVRFIKGAGWLHFEHSKPRSVARDAPIPLAGLIHRYMNK